MKKFLLLLFLGAVSVLGAAEKVELVKVASCYVPNGKAAHLLEADGMLSLKGPTNYQNYGYLVARVQCKPFTIAGKALILEVKTANFADNDNFYVKGLDASGKIVTSFRVTANISGDWNILTCVPGKRGSGISYSGKESKNPTGEIVTLQIFCGRRGPGKAQEVQIRNMHVAEAAPASSVMRRPLDKPGKITILNVPTSYSTGGKSSKKLDGDTLTFKGDCAKKQYNYLVAKLEVTPFIFRNASLALKVKWGSHKPKDSFYVKAYNAQGKIVASFLTRADLTGDGFEMVCTPQHSAGGVIYNAGESKNFNEDTPVVFLQIYSGRFGPAEPFEIEIKDLRLIERPAVPSSANFRNHGVGIASAELRHFIACHDANGKRLIISSFSDHGPDYLVINEVETGKSTQYYSYATGGSYGGVLTSKGKFVYGVAGTVYIFDINKRTFLKGGKCVYAALVGTEGPDGKVYLGGASKTEVTMVDPDTGKTENLGRFDDKENYASYLAVDKAGYVYAGIGTARSNVVAMNIKTRERFQLVPEEHRKLGTGHVITGNDGYVYISSGNFTAKCLEGKIVEHNVRCGDPKKVLSIKYQRKLKYFDDGSEVVKYDTAKKVITVKNSDGSLKELKYDFKAGGLGMTSMAAGPDGNVYFSSSHPHHLGKLDVKTGKITDLGHNPKIGGGNMCNMVAYNGKLYGCEYGGGRLWEFDPAKEPSYIDALVTNFGVPMDKLIYHSAMENGTWRELSAPPVLLAIGDNENNRFTLNLEVPADGKYYVNMQFLHAKVYGIVTFNVGGKEFKYDAFAEDLYPGKMLNLGPFELKKGKTPVVFQVKKSDNPKSKLFFSLIGIEVAQTARPNFPGADVKRNPQILGSWSDLVHRPRTIAVDPVSKDIVIAGFANYGMTGGGFGIWNSVTGKNREIVNWLPGESCYDMIFTADGKLIGGTSVEAPGGGHEIAKCASVFMMDWKTGKVIKRLQLPGVRKVFGVEEFGKYIFAVTANGELYRINKATWQIEEKTAAHSSPIDRNPLVKTPDGKRLFLLQGRAITEIDMATGKAEWVARPPMHLSSGSAIVGNRIYFIFAQYIGSWEIPPKKQK